MCILRRGRDARELLALGRALIVAALVLAAGVPDAEPAEVVGPPKRSEGAEAEGAPPNGEGPVGWCRLGRGTASGRRAGAGAGRRAGSVGYDGNGGGGWTRWRFLQDLLGGYRWATGYSVPDDPDRRRLGVNMTLAVPEYAAKRNTSVPPKRKPIFLISDVPIRHLKPMKSASVSASPKQLVLVLISTQPKGKPKRRGGGVPVHLPASAHFTACSAHRAVHRLVEPDALQPEARDAQRTRRVQLRRLINVLQGRAPRSCRAPVLAQSGGRSAGGDTGVLEERVVLEDTRVLEERAVLEDEAVELERAEDERQWGCRRWRSSNGLTTSSPHGSARAGAGGRGGKRGPREGPRAELTVRARRSWRSGMDARAWRRSLWAAAGADVQVWLELGGRRGAGRQGGRTAEDGRGDLTGITSSRIRRALVARFVVLYLPKLSATHFDLHRRPSPPPPPSSHVRSHSHPTHGLSSRRLPPEAQYRALLGLGPTAYQQEGPGDLYFCVRFQPSLVASVDEGRLPPNVLDTADLEIKGGSSRDVDMRIPQYAVCERTQHAVLFWAYCTVPYRLFAERLFHLKLKARGAALVPERCGGCKVKHREFYSLSVFPSLAEFKALVKSVVEDAGGVYNLLVAADSELCKAFIQSDGASGIVMAHRQITASSGDGSPPVPPSPRPKLVPQLASDSHPLRLGLPEGRKIDFRWAALIKIDRAGWMGWSKCAEIRL
ncbi:hypothetical protein FB451DRAFT_1200033 [Mycena latifolia]|nr:hypothetical protein FB451DRAFT_1200033 [Mycena latifolia]